MDRKYPNAPSDWRWQWVLPQEHRWRNHKTGQQGWYRDGESIVQRAEARAVREAGPSKWAAWHTCRHFFATHRLADGYGIRTVPKLMGHRDVKRTMIYTHVLHGGGRGARGPLDAL